MKHVLALVLAGAIFTSVDAVQAQRAQPLSNISPLVQHVQSSESFRINELEERVRDLTGKVEELNFILLQLQEKLRQLEEDSEIRFQELEDKRSDAGSTAQPLRPPREIAGAGRQENIGDNRLGKPDTSGADRNPAPDAKTTRQAVPGSSAMEGARPSSLGTLTFDQNGNVVDSRSSNPQKLTGLPGVFSDGVEGGVEASQFGSTPQEVLKEGLAQLQLRNYTRAQQAFLAHIKAWPEDPDAGVARYYLGESYFWQKEYYRAADTHLEAHNKYPEASTAPDNLLALGLALAGLNQREVACATYAEVLKQYPTAQPRLGQRVRDEQTAARC